MLDESLLLFAVGGWSGESLGRTMQEESEVASFAVGAI